MADGHNIIDFPGLPEEPPVLQIRVDLLLMPYPIWRRLVLPGRSSFWDLHVAIQDSMGWQDKHLHRFTLDDPGRGEHLRLGIPDDSSFHGLDEVLAGWEYPVTRFCSPGGASMLYTYDLGDEWQHEVSLESLLHGWSPAGLPTCSEGEGACPPEDSGGPQGFAELPQSTTDEGFDPGSVIFENPRERWHRAFGHD